MKPIKIFSSFISVTACLAAFSAKAQDQTVQGKLFVYNTLSQTTADAGQAVSLHDNNISGDTRFLAFGRLGNNPFIRNLNSQRIVFLNQNGSTANAEIADDGFIYPRSGVVANYLVEKAGHWDAATSAEIQTTGGQVIGGGPQNKTFEGGWRVTGLGQSLILDLQGSVSVNYITFGTFYALDPRYIPAGYSISYSADNVSYTTFATVTGNTSLNPIHNAGGISARYWKITVNAFQPSEISASINGLKILSTIGSSSNGNYWGAKYGGSDISFNGGGVSIGTNNLPSGYRLAVNGAILSTKVKVLTYPNWPDYVFEKEYEIPSLEEVEAYIQKHKHLPDVPSAATVEKEGLDLGDSQAILLRKIEELTLYIIEQNKKIEEQNKKIQKPY